jgi:hypothetical protein
MAKGYRGEVSPLNPFNVRMVVINCYLAARDRNYDDKCCKEPLASVKGSSVVLRGLPTETVLNIFWPFNALRSLIHYQPSIL